MMTSQVQFFCRRCERVIDIEVSCPASCPVAESSWVKGNRVETVQACLCGICSNCLEKEEENKKI